MPNAKTNYSNLPLEDSKMNLNSKNKNNINKALIIIITLKHSSQKTNSKNPSQRFRNK